MSTSHGIKGRTIDEAFQGLFLWERRAPIGTDFELFNFSNLLHVHESM